MFSIIILTYMILHLENEAFKSKIFQSSFTVNYLVLLTELATLSLLDCILNHLHQFYYSLIYLKIR